jgi:hypothetical protein
MASPNNSSPFVSLSSHAVNHSWRYKANVTAPVLTCDSSGNPLLDVNLQSGCSTGGSAFTCPNQQPIIINDTLAYGFAAVALGGQTEADWCCSCYKLTFTSQALKGKVLIVQVRAAVLQP